MSTAFSRSAPAAAATGRESKRQQPAWGGIVFDVPGVFYEVTLWRRWLFQLLGRMGANPAYAQFDHAWEVQLADVHRGRREYAEALQSFLLSYGLTWAQVDEVEAASRIKRKQLELDVRPLPGVARAVEELNRRGLPLVAWADVPHSAAKLSERLERLVPAARFAAVLTSFDLEFVQPDPRCYSAILQHVGCAAERILYVGHVAEHLVGAATAGLRTVAVHCDGPVSAQRQLASLEELLAIVDSGRLENPIVVSPPMPPQAVQSSVLATGERS